MNDLTKKDSDSTQSFFSKLKMDLPSFESPKFDPHLVMYDPPEYEDTFFKQQADDIAKQINEKTSLQIDALENMSESLRLRVDVAERELSLYQRELKQAKHDAAVSHRFSVISIIIAIASVAVSVVKLILQ